jgi:hypothetical protein
MSSTPPDQTAMMKEVLDALKNLQVNQVQLASNVDAITGRVNVLAGMKEVRDIAADTSTSASSKQTEAAPSTPSVAESLVHDEAVPSSPSLPADQIEGGKTSIEVSHARKPSVTSRIILTYVSHFPPLIMVHANIRPTVHILDNPASTLFQWTGVIKIRNNEVQW